MSSASLQIPESENGKTTGIFSGNLSFEVTQGAKWNISRGGFCGMRSKKVAFFPPKTLVLFGYIAELSAYSISFYHIITSVVKYGAMTDFWLSVIDNILTLIITFTYV